MKINKFIYIICFAVMFVGCQDYFGEDSNVDPDNPTDVTVNVLLPQVEARLAYTYGGDFVRYAAINTQYIDGIDRQFAVLGKYGISGSDVNQIWANVYTGIMSSNREMISRAELSGFNHYHGIGLALEAYTIMMVSDVFGDVPYSDAFKFAKKAVYTPAFDTQADIYTNVLDLLDQARVLLNSDDGGNPVEGDDLIYGGSAQSWITFCNVIEARAKLHLSGRDGNMNAVVSALNKGDFTSSNDEAKFIFGNTATEASPMNQYLDQRQGDTEVGASFVSLLESLSDPRVATFGAVHSTDNPIFTQDQPVKLISFTEQEFIKAEALFSIDKAESFAALSTGIASSFVEAKITASAEDYMADLGLGENTMTLDDILTQKYIALYTSPESWSDWRRTGVPDLTPNTGTEIPRRFPYPDSEVLANPNTPTAADINIFDRVWWDM
jgi:hypothetical protein